MSSFNPSEIARELAQAYSLREVLATPLSARDGSFDLDKAYAVEGELARQRTAGGRSVVGRKVGYANKAVWRALKLETLVWAHMYDDTVRFAPGNTATLDVGGMCSPKIEPEIVLKVRSPLGDATDAADVLKSVEWIALGFEIIDCVYADWKFQPADFVAAFGLHAALVVGEPRSVDAATIPLLVEQLAHFKLRLLRNDVVVAEGAGKNSLKSPALCLGELASAIARRMPDEPLVAGELVSSGTLTESQPISAGETWIAVVDGIDLSQLSLSIR